MMCIIYVDEVVVYVRPDTNSYKSITNSLLHTLYYLCYHYLQCNNNQQKLQNIRNNCKLSEINKNNYEYPYCICARCSV